MPVDRTLQHLLWERIDADPRLGEEAGPLIGAAADGPQPGPGLTLVVGRNGSGKSSFAETVEILLTGDNRRWSERSSIWREGWRNLHHPFPTEVSAKLAVEGVKGGTSVRRWWPQGAELEQSVTEGPALWVAEDGLAVPRLGAGACRVPPLPVLQRARLHAR